MGEFQKKWFQIVWACLLIASVVMNYIQRYSDAAWAHSAGFEMLGKVLMWIVLPLTVILFVWKCVGYWRAGERLFWRKWLRWTKALLAGVVLSVVFVLVIRYFRGDALMLEQQKQVIIFFIFAGAGLVWGVAKYMFRNRH